MISFRPLEQDDFEMLLEWLQRPHVKEWGDDGDDTLQKVAEHYGGEDGTERFIMQRSGESDSPVAAGYFQYYRRDEGVVGIDQFLAYVDDLNRGLGTEAITQFIQLIADRESPSSIVADPSPDNRRAIRCYEKAGFQYRETGSGWKGASAYMMELKLVSK